MLLDERDGNRPALGRLLSMVEAGGTDADKVATLAHPRAGNTFVIGMTGAPGAGKSTLTGRLTSLLSADRQRVAVLAIDPTSPLSGGAILGDRIRMDGVAPEQVFIRSMATRGHHGGLSLAAPGMFACSMPRASTRSLSRPSASARSRSTSLRAADTTVMVVNAQGLGGTRSAQQGGPPRIGRRVRRQQGRPSGRERCPPRSRVHARSGSGRPRWRTVAGTIVATTATDGTGIADLAAAIEPSTGHG